MRRYLLALVFVCLAVRLDAQSCGLIQYFYYFNATAQSCKTTPDTGGRHYCAPGSLVHLEVLGHTGNPASCDPPVLTWDFGDKSPQLVTKQNKVDHTFPLGVNKVRVTSPRAGGGTAESYIYVGVYHGTYLTAPVASVAEDAGKVRVTVTRNDSAHDSSIEYSAGPATAVTPITGKLSFAAGETTKYVDVPLLDDTIFTGQRTAKLTLQKPSNNYALDWGKPSVDVEFTITDDDTPVEFRCAERSIKGYESQGKVALVVERTGGLASVGTGTFTIYRRGSNNPETMREVAFPAGASTAAFDFPIGDEVYTGNREYLVACSGWQGTVRPPNVEYGANVFLTVIEDEPYPVFRGTPLIVDEDDGDAALRLSWSPAFGYRTAAGVLAIDGTAKVGADFHAPSDLYFFPAGATSGELPIRLMNDSAAEADEEFEVQIRAGGAQIKVPVTILDDDRPAHALTLDKQSYQFDEAEPATVKVTRGGDTSGTTSATLRIESPGHVQWPDDVAIEFAAGETSKNLRLSLDDHWYTSGRDGILQLITAGYVADSASISVRDDEPRPVLTVADVAVREGAAGQTTKVELLLTLTGEVGVDLHADIATADGTADSADYTAVDDHVFFPPGQLTRRVTIDVHGDGAVEPGETFTLSIEDCCAPLATLGTRTATVTILDDDGNGGGDGPGGGSGDYTFEDSPTVEWNEGEKWLVATVVRGDNTAGGTATVRLTLDEARQFWPVSLRFRPNEARKTVRFYIDDHYYSGDATGKLTLLDGTALEDERAVKIVENEARPRISVADIEVTEGRGDRTASFTVSVVPPSFQPLQVTVQATPNKIAPDVQIPETQSVRIPSLVSSVAVPFTIVGDNIPENDESFDVGLWLLQETHAVYGDRLGTCTIHDDDRANARLDFASDRVERGTSITAELVLGDPAASAGTIALSSTAEVSVPATAAVTAGVKRIEFPVTGTGLGEAVVRAALPGGATIEERLFVYTVGALSLPTSIRVTRGGVVHIPLSLTHAEEQPFTVSIASSDAKIASPPLSAGIPAGAAGTFEVYGAANGHATLTLTLPAELGGTSFTIPVEVVEPQGKRRSTR
jgi:hypothetical protein